MKKLKALLQQLSSPTTVAKWVGLDRFDDLYERIINSELALKWLSFLIITLIYISTQIISPITWEYAEDVRGKTLTVLIDEEHYVVEGLPKTIDFTIEGKESIVKTLVKNNTFNAYVDLTNLKPGQHIVKINYDVLPNSVKVSTDPENVSILIKELVSIESSIEVDYLYQELLKPTIVLGKPILSQSQVQVKGPKDELAKLARIQAFVDVSGVEKTESYTIPLYAFDKEGNKLNLALEPSEISVQVPYTIPQKEVPLKASLIGELPDGKLIKNITTSIDQLNVFAPQPVLDELTEIVVDLQIDQLDESGKGTFNLSTPTGITQLSESQIVVTVEFEDIQTKTIENIPVEVQNLDKTLKLKQTPNVTLTFTGSAADLEHLEAKSIPLSINATDLKAGTHTVPVEVTSTLPSTVTLKEESTIKITLIKK